MTAFALTLGFAPAPPPIVEAVREIEVECSVGRRERIHAADRAVAHGARRLDAARPRAVPAAAAGVRARPGGRRAAGGRPQRLRQRAARELLGRAGRGGPRGHRHGRDAAHEPPGEGHGVAQPAGRRDRDGDLRAERDRPARAADVAGAGRAGGTDRPARHRHPVPAPARAAQRLRVLRAARADHRHRPGLLPAARAARRPAGGAQRRDGQREQHLRVRGPLRHGAPDDRGGGRPRRGDQGAAAGARARRAPDPARARADAHTRAAAAGRAARRDGADAVGGPPDGRAGDRRPQQPGRDRDRHRRPGCRRPAPGRPRERPRRRARAQRLVLPHPRPPHDRARQLRAGVRGRAQRGRPDRAPSSSWRSDDGRPAEQRCSPTRSIARPTASTASTAGWWSTTSTR